MRTPRGPSRTLWSLHRTVSTSDVSVVTRRHTRVGIRNRPMCCPSSRSSRIMMRSSTCEPEDFCFALPVRARRALAQRRLPSYREPASRNPQAMHTEAFWEPVHTRTVSPSAHPRPASDGATNFFLASALSIHQQVLRPPGGEDARCVQPMSATQTIACTRTSRVPGSLSQLSPRGRPTETKAPCGIAGGPGVSRRPKTASADRDRTRNSSSTASRPGDTSVGVFFPRC
jgi:hypothetical protein